MGILMKNMGIAVGMSIFTCVLFYCIKGNISGTVIGALIIGLIANGLNLLNVPQGAQRMVKGVIIVAAVIFDVLRRKRTRK
jgi:ribose/xylose/arabinose/galactoside ABC-type transport system permease subunit